LNSIHVVALAPVSNARDEHRRYPEAARCCVAASMLRGSRQAAARYYCIQEASSRACVGPHTRRAFRGLAAGFFVYVGSFSVGCSQLMRHRSHHSVEERFSPPRYNPNNIMYYREDGQVISMTWTLHQALLLRRLPTLTAREQFRSWH
jgi:hypothetical protein